MVGPPDAITDRLIPPRQGAGLDYLPLGETDGPLRRAGVLFGGFGRLEPPFELGRRQAGFHVLLWTLGGQGEASDGRSLVRLGPGDLLIAPAGQPHWYRSLQAWRICWLHLAVSPRWRGPPRQDQLVRRSGWLGQVQTAMTALVQEERQALPGRDRARAAQAEILLVAVERELAGLAPDPGGDSPLRGLWRWVAAHPEQDWSLANLAFRVRCSRAQLHRDCRRWHRCAPATLVRRLRLERAADLLATSGLTLDALAPAVGYASGFALSRAFARQYGLAPEAFRRQGRG